jgi:hypothetical protein
MQLTKILAVAALAAFLAGGGTARADILFTDKPANLCQLSGLGGGCEVNILFQGPEIGSTITGQVDHTGVGVTFDTLTKQQLDQKAEGQADIFCTTGGVNGCPTVSSSLTDLLTSIEMIAQPGTAWTDAHINLNNGTGTALVTVTDQAGATFTDVLGHGNNDVGIYVKPGTNEVITDIQVTNNDTSATPVLMGFEDFKQPRVSGLCTLVGATCIPVPIPEPTSLVLLGMGVMGLGLLARRRRN